MTAVHFLTRPFKVAFSLASPAGPYMTVWARHVERSETSHIKEILHFVQDDGVRSRFLADDLSRVARIVNDPLHCFCRQISLDNSLFFPQINRDGLDVRMAG